MQKPLLPNNETLRINELKKFCILDTAPEATYSAITTLASQICQTPIALISLVDEDRQWFKAKIGLDAAETPREISFCGHAILSTNTFIVPDALKDERFFDNPLVLHAPHVRFYAGAPIITNNNLCIGTLCVVDTVPRNLSEEQRNALEVLAKQVAALLELRYKNKELTEKAIEACELSESVAERESSIRALYDITSASGLSLNQKIDNLLNFGVSWSHMESGVLSKFADSFCEITNIYSLNTIFKSGMKLPLNETFCEKILQSKKPVYFEQAKGTEWSTHKAYERFQIESYIGAPVFVGDELYGTLHFFSLNPRRKNFRSDEVRFIQLMTQWIGLELLRIKNLEEIDKQQKALLYTSKMSSLGEMAGGIAHEINNPLAVISGYNNLLHMKAQETSFTKENVLQATEKIDQTVNRITKIIQGLREFSRNAESDDFSVSSVQKILQDTFELCNSRCKNEGIDLCIDKVSEQLSIQCRPIQVSQILLNLMNNALDAVSGKDERWIEVKVIDLGHDVRFTVRNSGEAIPESIRHKIMQPFFTTKPLGKGTGLGLSISLGLTQGHRGKLYLDNTDQHTCFILELPKEQEPLKKAI